MAFFQVIKIRSPEEHLPNGVFVDTRLTPAAHHNWSKEQDYHLWRISHGADASEQQPWNAIETAELLEKNVADVVARASYLQSNHHITSASPAFRLGRLVFSTVLQQRFSMAIVTVLRLHWRQWLSRRDGSEEVHAAVLVAAAAAQVAEASGQAILVPFSLCAKICRRGGHWHWQTCVQSDIEHYLVALIQSVRSTINPHDVAALAAEYGREVLYVDDFDGSPGIISKMVVYLLNSGRRSGEYVEAVYMERSSRKMVRGFLSTRYMNVISADSVSEQQSRLEFLQQATPTPEKVIGKPCQLAGDDDIRHVQEKLTRHNKRLRQKLAKVEFVLDKLANSSGVDISGFEHEWHPSSEEEEHDDQDNVQTSPVEAERLRTTSDIAMTVGTTPRSPRLRHARSTHERNDATQTSRNLLHSPTTGGTDGVLATNYGSPETSELESVRLGNRADRAAPSHQVPSHELISGGPTRQMWLEQWSEEHSCAYYVNSNTNQTVWIKPDDPFAVVRASSSLSRGPSLQL
jgi:hypothetical protein